MLAIQSVRNTDRIEFERLNKAILLESISFRYLLIELFGQGDYKEPDLVAMKQSFRSDVLFLNISWYDSNPSIGEVKWLFQKWGI